MLAKEGFVSSMAASNSFSQSLLDWNKPDRANPDILFDPQTAGGLLAGVQADQADSLLARLAELGFAHAAILGEVTAGSSLKPIRVHV